MSETKQSATESVSNVVNIRAINVCAEHGAPCIYHAQPNLMMPLAEQMALKHYPGNSKTAVKKRAAFRLGWNSNVEDDNPFCFFTRSRSAWYRGWTYGNWFYLSKRYR